MSSSKHDASEPFTLEGYFLGFVPEGHKLKYLRLEVGDREVQIKLSKESRVSVGTVLHPGDRLQISGEQKRDRKLGTIKLKAFQISKSGSAKSGSFPSVAPPPVKIDTTQQKLEPDAMFTVRVCYKSGCRKRGGDKSQQRLESVLRDRNLHHAIEFEETGCLGKCSMAPNLVLMPGKHRLSGMSPEAIADFIEQLKR